jgi:AhpD family alkylhydroperoxidase
MDDTTSSSTEEVLATLRESRGKDLNIFRVLAANPSLLLPFSQLGTALSSGSLPPRLRELAILRTAGACSSAYETEQHAERARRIGIDEVEIAAALRADHYEWSPAESVILAAATELVDSRTLCDETWTALVRFFADAELVELVVLISFYLAVAHIAGGLDIPVETRQEI